MSPLRKKKLLMYQNLKDHTLSDKKRLYKRLQLSLFLSLLFSSSQHKPTFLPLMLEFFFLNKQHLYFIHINFTQIAGILFLWCTQVRSHAQVIRIFRVESSSLTTSTSSKLLLSISLGLDWSRIWGFISPSLQTSTTHANVRKQVILVFFNHCPIS